MLYIYQLNLKLALISNKIKNLDKLVSSTK